MNNTIKIFRAKKSITQAELADLIKVSRQTINAMELGKYVPSTVLALRLATIFEVEVSELFTLEETDWD
ncbi:MAG: helix-turn-helix transcriptional regulator [Flavobacteriaceae bacterium]